MQQPPNPEYPPAQQPTQPPYYQPQQTPVPPNPIPLDPRLSYQYGQYPPPQQPIKPRKSRTWLWIVGIVLAFLVGRASVTATSSNTIAPQTSTTNTTTSQPAATQPTQAPTKPLTWQTTQTFSGNGNKKTTVFAVNDNWRILWSCTPDPSANSIGGYDFSVNVDNSDTSMADLDALSGSCKPGNTQLTTNEHQAGSVYLDVISGSGPWTITVQELK